MSSARRRACVAFVAAIAGMSPAVVGAQARLHDARTSIARQVREATDSVAAIDARMAALAVAVRSLPTDTVKDGEFVLASAAELTGVARRALASVAPALRARYGNDALALALDHAVVRVSRVSDGQREAAQQFLQLALARESYESYESHQASVLIVNHDTTAALAAYVTSVAAELVYEHTDAALKLWMRAGRFANSANDLRAAFVDLVTAPALVNRECAAGDLARCVAALGLDSRSRPDSTWYTDDDRRVVARAWWAARPRPLVNGRAPRNPCATAPVTNECRTFMASLDAGVWTRPLGDQARMGVLRAAVDLGGNGAYARLLTRTSGSLGERLALVAQRPLGDVVAEWRTRVMSARPDPVRPRLSILIACALLGLAVVGTVALRQERT